MKIVWKVFDEMFEWRVMLFFVLFSQTYWAMDDVEEVEGYKPEPGFEEDSREPLADISLSDSTELWLIQWPINEVSKHYMLFLLS